MNYEIVIVELLKSLIINAPELAKSKYSGVHDINDTYRIHVSDFLPRFLYNKNYSDVLHDVAEKYFTDDALFDPTTLWLVIFKD